MKNRNIFFRSLLLIIFFISLSVIGYSQPLPTQHGGNGGTWVGGQAPIDGGLGIFLILSSIYGVINRFRIQKKKDIL